MPTYVIERDDRGGVRAGPRAPAPFRGLTPNPAA
jgi:hypothetical protein